MKQKRLINAYKALGRLYVQKLPIKTAYNVFLLKKSLEEPYKFEMEREKKIIEDNHGFVKENGDIDFPDQLCYASFRDMMIELNEMEVKIEVEPIDISIDLMDNLEITPYDIDALNGFVNFS